MRLYEGIAQRSTLHVFTSRSGTVGAALETKHDHASFCDQWRTQAPKPRVRVPVLLSSNDGNGRKCGSLYIIPCDRTKKELRNPGSMCDQPLLNHQQVAWTACWRISGCRSPSLVNIWTRHLMANSSTTSTHRPARRYGGDLYWEQW